MLKILFFLLALTTAAHAEAVAGQPAPELKGETIDGKSFDLATMKGRVVIVHFWATWCGPCREEMPRLDTYYRQHHAEGLEMIAISVDLARNSDKVRDAMKAYAFPAAMMSDLSANGFDKPNQIPETFIVDRNGILQSAPIVQGDALTDQALSKAISPSLRR